MYVVILTTALPTIQLFLYDIDIFMPVDILFILQGLYQLYTAKKQQKYKF